MEDLNKAFKEEFPGSHIPLDQERAKSFIRQREKELLDEVKEIIMWDNDILLSTLKKIKELSNE